MAGEVCLSHSQPARGESGGNGGRGTTAAGWAHRAWFIFLPRQRAAHLWLWWIGMLLTHTHTHAHTCPTHSVSHTTTCTLLLSHGRTHAHKLVDGYTQSHTGCSVPPDLISNEKMFTTCLHGLPPLSINSSQKYVWCIIIHCNCTWGLLSHPPLQAYPCASCCTVQQHTVKNIWTSGCTMINLCISAIILLNRIVICHISTDRRLATVD